MDIAALITWVITALGGFYMLGTWLSRGGAKAGNSRLPVPVVFGHFALAAIGLVVWVIYVITDKDALAWTAFGLLVPVALLGFAMLARWIPVHRARAAAAAPAATEQQSAPAERYFPVPVVAGHGLFAVVTVVLVLLTALGIGGS
ncbi:hypothetical protein OHT20_38905 [Streptomyces caniferus]|uniref:DUF2269 domain-containing protein n=1 Tax=Streptomyces caniferus TaxID=285557 RepID=A0A640S895_9ACTN|nr:hypothetical protein [Streptomyces caniferus]GFE07267.1 hypothetical protein Scani_35350 [Streptomyces caniferus]